MYEDQYACVRCGSNVEARRAVEIDEQIFCKHCLSEFTNSYGSKSLPKRRISTFLLIALSSIPGANYMYMGLVKKGLAFLILFFSIVMMGSYLHPFILAIPILYMYCFFDCLEKRRSIHMGIPVPDDASELTNFLLRYRVTMIYVVALLLTFDFFRNIGRSVMLDDQTFLSAVFLNLSHSTITLIGTVGLFYIISVCLKGSKSRTVEQPEKDYEEDDFIDMTK